MDQGAKIAALFMRLVESRQRKEDWLAGRIGLSASERNSLSAEILAEEQHLRDVGAAPPSFVAQRAAAAFRFGCGRR